MAQGDLINIEVAYALPNEQQLMTLNVVEGTTVEEAIHQSGIMEKFPEIDLSKNAVGVFGRVTDPGQVLSAGDRVEIYRPLIADPKHVRRERAALKAQSQAEARVQSRRNRGASGTEPEAGG